MSTDASIDSGKSEVNKQKNRFVNIFPCKPFAVALDEYVFIVHDHVCIHVRMYVCT